MLQLPTTPFTIILEGVIEPLRVMSLRGHEAVNELFVFEVVVAAPEQLTALEEEAINRVARLIIEGAEQPRLVCGIVQSARLTAGRRDWGGDVYRLTIVPKLWRLGPTRTSRIFQDMSVPEIVDAVLKPHDIPRTWSNTREYPKRSYCVQYQESDLDFVRRLLAEEGIFFSFDHPSMDAPQAAEMLFLADEAGCYRFIEGSHRVPLRDDTMVASEEAIDSFEWGGQLLTGSVLLKEYDFLRCALDLRGNAKAADGADAVETALVAYEHMGRFSGEHVNDLDARIQLERLRSERRSGQGTSCCVRLSPGRTFELYDAPTQRLNRSYVVTSVDHEGTDPAFSGNPDDGTARNYSNRFVCIPATIPCRPERRPTQAQQTFETATVVGPSESEIHTDPQGRIKVQFHWDLQGKRNDHSSCWMRVMQTWAGSGWGHQFIPRVGMEVLVLLLGGDIDNPFVIGSAYNGANPTPFALPENKTKSGLRTRSTPNSEGFNELSFEDLAGSEEIFLQAQRDLHERIKHNHETYVLNDQTNKVVRDQFEVVAGNQDLQVVGNRAETVDGERTRVVGGHETVDVGGNAWVTVNGDRRDSVDGDHQENVDGSHRQRVGHNCTLEVGDNLGIRATGGLLLEVTEHARVALSSDGLLTVGGNQTAIVEGNQTTTVGENCTLEVAGTLHLKASAFVLEVTDALDLSCGSSSITMFEDSIELRSPTVIVTGDEKVTLRAAEESLLELDANGKLVADKLEVQASGSALTLDSDAKLDGSKVSIGSGRGKASYTADKDDGKPNEPPELRVQLVHAWDKEHAYADLDVHITGHGPDRLDTKTDGQGWLTIPVHYEKCTIEVDMPGEELHWQLRHGDLADLEEDDGVRQRLGNLGFGVGSASHWSDRELLSALRSFVVSTRADDGEAECDEYLTHDYGLYREKPEEVQREIRRLIDRHREAIGKAAGG